MLTDKPRLEITAQYWRCNASN